MRLTKKLREKHSRKLQEIEVNLEDAFPFLDQSSIEYLGRLILREYLITGTDKMEESMKKVIKSNSDYNLNRC